MVVCSVVGCQNRPDTHKMWRYYRFPGLRLHEGDETKALTEKRRRMWKARINRDLPDEKWEKTQVCSKHFVNGELAYLHDDTSPSWLPSLHLGYDLKSEDSSERYDRRKGRVQKRRHQEAANSLLFMSQQELEIEPDHETTKNVQTDLTMNDVDDLEEVKRFKSLDSSSNHVHRSIYNIDTYRENPDYVSFYTALPTLAVLLHVFSFVSGHLNENVRSLSIMQQFLLCLVKLRMDYLFRDMAFQLNVSVQSVRNSFHNTLDVLFNKLSCFVSWPNREDVRRSMPKCFQFDFGKKVVVIVDCFELKCERPSGLENQTSLYSNYKSSHTIKYLIGISPQGVITFISKGWCGRTSDKFLTEQSGILENLLPNDIMMADRGFNIHEDVSFFQAKLVIPDFTKGKKQLHPVEIENTRKIASVRIHVERVIGLMKNKFRIFEGNVPIEYMKLRKGETDVTIDKIIHVCCSLTNFCKPIVPFD